MDATEEAILRFNDESQWDAVKDGVPVFMAHKRVVKVTNPDGTTKEQTIDVGVERLEKIAAEMRKNWQENGVPVTFYEGHTKDPFTVAQKDQPAVLGYGINPRVGMSRGKPAILVKQFVSPGCLEKAKQLPHRSAEFIPGNNSIPGVAMLKTPPWLNMGVVLYDGQEKAFKANRCLPYQSQNGQRVFLYMGDGTMADPTAMPDANEDSDMEFDGKCARYMNRNYPRLADQHKQWEADYAATLGSLNSDMPAPVGGDASPMGEDTPMPDEKLKADYQALKAENLALKRTIQYSGELAAMVAAGAQINYAAELAYCAGGNGEPGLTPNQFARHKAILKQSTAPVGPMLPTADPKEVVKYQAKQDTTHKASPASGEPQFEDDEDPLLEKTIRYQVDHKCDFKTAYAAVCK